MALEISIFFELLDNSLNCPNRDSYFISNFYTFHFSLTHTKNAGTGFIWNCHDLSVQIEKEACILNNKD
jgi:hypothetical protein